MKENKIYSESAEQSVLGSLMLDNRAFHKINDKINEEDFYIENHKKIFLIIKNLHDRNLSMDPLIVAEKLNDINELENIGGEVYLFELANQTPTASNVEAYANIVRERTILRKLVKLANEILENKNNLSVMDLLDFSESEAKEIQKMSL